jgi:uncharacterized delta-60 repeat protein
MFAEVDLNLTVTNNVNYPVQINILGNPSNLLDTSNAKTEYQWDVTAFTFGSENDVTIEYKINGAAAYSTYSGQFAPQTLQAVVDVLNGLGIGFFSLYTVGANTYIGTYNDQYTFGNLNIFSTTFLFGTGFDSILFATTTQADGKIVCTGAFTTYNGTPVPGFICRINTDGTLDTSFQANVGTGFDSAPSNVIQLQSGELLVAGNFFTLYNGVATPLSILKLSSAGIIDATFSLNAGTGLDNSGANYYGNVIEQPDGNILIGGQNLIQYNGNLVGHIIRITPTGLLDPLFEPNGIAAFSGPGIITNVFQIALNATNGKIYCIGDFDTYTDSGGPHPVNQICALNSNGTYDATFVGGTGVIGSPNVQSSFVQPDGKLVLSSVDYQGTIASIIRINPNGTIDTVGLGTSFDNSVSYVAVLNSGNIICSGFFTNYNGTPANGIIILTTAMAVYSVPFGTGFFTGYAYNSIINPASAIVNLGGSMQAEAGGPFYITQITV